MRAPEQLRFQGPPGRRQRGNGRGGSRQSVPHLRAGDWECSVVDRLVCRSWNDKLRRRRRTQPTARANVSDTLQLASDVSWRCTVKAAVDENGESKLDPLWDSQPMQFTEQRRNVFASPRCVDESRGSVENGLQPVQLPCRQASQRRAAVVESRQYQCRDERLQDRPGQGTTDASDLSEHREAR